ncbi:MAG: hypothetical protein M1830_010617 [Pleopsidium flavum]|nr:MAG: hypothetical protein M1830_010617 [Pleopsidium flavum]
MDIQHLCFLDTADINRGYAEKLLANVKRVEKKTFPAIEAFNFDTELKKHNTHLVCALNAKPGPKEDAPLIAYLVYARTKKTALLHKICVLQQHREQGIGKQMMAWLQLELANRGCQNVQLWVDQSREPARALYASLGFEQADRVVDYYAPSRSGLKMVFHLRND